MVNREIMLEGLRPCPSCAKTVPVKVTYELGFTYTNTYCNYENKYFRTLVGKGTPDKDWDIIPSSWPRLVIKERGNFYKDDNENVINIGKVKFIYFYITTRCNAFCKICRVYEEPFTDMSLNFFKQRIKKYKNKYIILMGGEPTVREDLSEFIDIIHRSGNIPVIWTNGIKLADIEYVKTLKRKGLRFVFFSFDGFLEEFYEQCRGSKNELLLKLEALDNLNKERIETILSVTLVRKLNDNQTSSIINYAKDKNFIKGILFNPLYLYGNEINFGLSLDNILSKDEIIEGICKSLNIHKEIFELWNDIKIKGALFLEKVFPWLPLPTFWRDVIYLKRLNGEFTSLLNIKEMQKLKKDLDRGIIVGLSAILKFLLSNFLYNIRFILSYNNEKKLFSIASFFKITVICITRRCFTGETPVTAITENENLNLRRKDSFTLLKANYPKEPIIHPEAIESLETLNV